MRHPLEEILEQQTSPAPDVFSTTSHEFQSFDRFDPHSSATLHWFHAEAQRLQHDAEKWLHAHPQKKAFEPFPASPSKLWLDLYCGTGWFASLLTKTHDQFVCIGVDRESSRIKRAKKLSQRLGTESRCHFVCSKSLPFLSHACVPNSLDGASVFYPNLIPKTTHRNRRFSLSLDFVFVTRALKVDAPLIVASDSLSYIHDVARMMKIHNFRIETSMISPDQREKHIPRSAFEFKFLHMGKSLYQVQGLKGVSKPELEKA